MPAARRENEDLEVTPATAPRQPISKTSFVLAKPRYPVTLLAALTIGPLALITKAIVVPQWPIVGCIGETGRAVPGLHSLRFGRLRRVEGPATSAHSANGFVDVPGFKSACFLAWAISC